MSLADGGYLDELSDDEYSDMLAAMPFDDVSDDGLTLCLVDAA